MKTLKKLTCLLTVIALMLAMAPFAFADDVDDDFVDLDDRTVPHIGFLNGYKTTLESSYGGSTIPFYLWTPEQGVYDPGGSLAKLKNGKKYDMSHMVRAESSDNSIAKVKRVYWDKSIEWEKGDEISIDLALTLLKPGKVTITFRDAKYGKKLEELNLKITKKAIVTNWKEDLLLDNFEYGATRLIAHARSGDKAVLKIKGKTYTKTISAKGTAVFKLPLLKPETEGTVTFYKKGASTRETLTFDVDDEFARVDLNKVKPGSRHVTGTIRKPVKGDTIKIKAGGKTYTKKVNKTAPTLKFKQKVGKLNKGSKVQVLLYSKFKEVRAGDSRKVK